MKKVSLILVCIIAYSVSMAQSGARLGVKGAYNSTWLFNKHVSDAGDELDYKSSFGSQIGINSLFNLSDNVGIVAELLFGTINQKYTNRDSGSTVYETQLIVKTIDIPVLFRYTADIGAFFEVGPEFSIISSAKFKGPGGSVTIDKDQLAPLNIAVALGFGYDIGLTDQLYLNTGLRFAWGVTDVFKKQDGETDHEATNTAVGGLNLGLTYAFSRR